MEIAAAISILIALSGSAYAVLSIFKASWANSIRNANEERKDLIEEIDTAVDESLHSEKEFKEAHQVNTSIRCNIHVWKITIAIPVVVFCGLTAAATLIVVFAGDPKQACSWLLYRIVVGVVFGIYAVCIVVAVFPHKAVAAEIGQLRALTGTLQMKTKMLKIESEHNAGNQQTEIET